MTRTVCGGSLYDDYKGGLRNCGSTVDDIKTCITYNKEYTIIPIV